MNCHSGTGSRVGMMSGSVNDSCRPKQACFFYLRLATIPSDEMFMNSEILSRPDPRETSFPWRCVS